MSLHTSITSARVLDLDALCNSLQTNNYLRNIDTNNLSNIPELSLNNLWNGLDRYDRDIERFILPRRELNERIFNPVSPNPNLGDWGLNPQAFLTPDEGPIPEDSRLRKFLACLPIVGIAITMLNERSLQKRIRRSRNLTRIVKMIQVKNHYKIASIIRSILTAAIVVSVVFAVFKAPVFILIASGATCMVGAVAIIVYACFRHKNIKLIHSFNKRQPPENILFRFQVNAQGFPKSIKIW